MMTNQKAYEMMRAYLGRPDARQAKEGKTCRYETVIDGETHRCAVGLLFSPEGLNETITLDEETAAGFGVLPGEVSVKDYPGTVFGLFGVGFRLADLDGIDREFLRAAQAIHDTEQYWFLGPAGVVRQLDRLAAHWGLKVVRDERPVAAGAPQADRELVTV